MVNVHHGYANFPDSGREFAMLRAIAAGRAAITRSGASDLFLDGQSCCDRSVSRHLVRAGLVRATIPAKVGQLVRAEHASAGPRSAGNEGYPCPGMPLRRG
jgi:hypothetical protein